MMLRTKVHNKPDLSSPDLKVGATRSYIEKGFSQPDGSLYFETY